MDQQDCFPTLSSRLLHRLDALSLLSSDTSVLYAYLSYGFLVPLNLPLLHCYHNTVEWSASIVESAMQDYLMLLQTMASPLKVNTNPDVDLYESLFN